MQIILDTDFLIHSTKNKIDIFEEIKKEIDGNYLISIIDKTLDELKGKKEEKLIKDLLENKKVNIISTKKDKIVDDLILEIVDKSMIIATQDRDLIEKLKQKGIKTLIIRQRKYLRLN